MRVHTGRLRRPVFLSAQQSPRIFQRMMFQSWFQWTMRSGSPGWENAAPMRMSSTLLLAAAALASGLAFAGKTTVCTVTVNSDDEREVFRENLPLDKYQFVELVEGGRPDWLAASCRRGIQCDVLIVSGHFAGTEFYSSQPQVSESLPVDEMERVQCGDSCPALFAKLKEVYLFGCDSLKAEPVKSAMPEVIRGLIKSGQPQAEAEHTARELSERYAESARDRMRRIFSTVPVIYGFSSFAPYGRVAGPMLRGYFQGGTVEEVGSGRPSEQLLKLFGAASMVTARGNAAIDREACRLYDERIPTARKLDEIHRMVGGEMVEVRMAFDFVERFLGALTPPERADPSVVHALGALEQDRAARDRYLAITRDTEDPALRVRMIALASSVGWLSLSGQKAEHLRMIDDLLAGDSMDSGEVDLICSLNRDGGLDSGFRRGSVPADRAPQAAALACLGSSESHARVLRALASPDEVEVRVAQAYLRHRPITDPNELRAVAFSVARMKSSGAQVRALDALARHHITDRGSLDELGRLFARTPSLAVQIAIAEIFIRTDRDAYGAPEVLALLRQHRLQSPNGLDLIDTLIQHLQAS